MERCTFSLKVFFLNGPTPASFIVYFWSFQANIISILQQLNVEKCPSSIRCRDSNPQPSEYESPPTTTGPWLPPRQSKEVVNVLLCRYMIQIVVLPFKYISHTLSLLMNIL